MKVPLIYLKRGLIFVPGMLMLFVPLLRDYHLESALLFSLTGCVVAAHIALSTPSHDLKRAVYLVFLVYAASTPILIHSLLTGCFSTDGMGFWVFYPSSGVLFGYAIGRVVRLLRPEYPYVIVYTLLVIIAIIIPLIELRLMPQVFLYNHVWGGWPGPIYDEAARFTSSHVFFRFITLTWTILLWVIPTFWTSKLDRMLGLIAMLSLFLSYSQLKIQGIISPEAHIQQVLGSVHATDHFNIYYDADEMNSKEIYRLATWHEFHFQELTALLDVTWPEGRKIHSYIYPNSWIKHQLTGARYTNYVPVWHEQDQVHIAYDVVEPILRHELVHVIAKQFAHPVFGASLSIGLTEGLAVSLESASARRLTPDQYLASSGIRPTLEELKQTFSLTGFYTGRASVNYTMAGSLVRHAIQTQPLDHLKRAYRHSNLSKGFNDLTVLHKSWLAHLDTVAYTESDSLVTRSLFSEASIFEKPCPRIVTQTQKEFDTYLQYKTVGSDKKARALIERLKRQMPESLTIWMYWSEEKIKSEQARSVITDTISFYMHPLYLIRLADAKMITGDTDGAEIKLQQAQLQADSLENGFRLNDRLTIRKDTMLWKELLQLVYKSEPSETSPLDPYLLSLWISHMQTNATAQGIRVDSLPTYDHKRNTLAVYLLAAQYALIEGNESETLSYLNDLLNVQERETQKEMVHEVIRWANRYSSRNERQ